MLHKEGYVAHPTNNPWEAIAYGRQEVPQFSGKANLWEAYAAILPYATLAEAIADGFFEPAKAFADEPEMLARYATWLEEAYRMPLAGIADLENRPPKSYLSKALRLAISANYGLGICLRGDGLWDTYTKGLAAYEGATLKEAIHNALRACPHASHILAFMRTKPLRYCQPCGFWLAELDMASAPVHVIDLSQR